MIVNDSHLSWCLNIYPGESLEETKLNIQKNAPQVKEFLAELGHEKRLENGLGLGLRLAADTVNKLHGNTAEFKDLLDRNELYAFTVNAFPYGNFHQVPVKENVYYPDWSEDSRLDYSMKTGDILSELLPQDQLYGSISTVPVTYGKKLDTTTIKNFIKLAKHYKHIEEYSGKIIQMALEPEPDCFLETTDEAIRYYDMLRNEDQDLAERYLGICLDTCHMALQFEKPIDSLNRFIEANVTLPKIQISSVLSYKNKGNIDPLRKYDEQVYLHQTLVQNEEGEIQQYSDLNLAIDDNPAGEWRVHFHVPLYFEENSQGLRSTSHLIDQEFMQKAFKHCRHLETETYTFGVLPNAIENVNKSIAQEFDFVLKKLS
ncbi:MAG: metabolite traffic protein EboE [Lentisphaeraceae bacterium]|nr:metabolite traffic protein EboE [Lentisphaeraceae bacterium]